jgi:hypothetical protein
MSFGLGLAALVVIYFTGHASLRDYLYGAVAIALTARPLWKAFHREEQRAMVCEKQFHEQVRLNEVSARLKRIPAVKEDRSRRPETDS